MTECKRALSAYVPVNAPSYAPIELALPLQVYIIETIGHDARKRLLRQVVAVTALVAGIFACQWPAEFSAANAVPSLPISAKAAGARAALEVNVERLAFAPSLR